MAAEPDRSVPDSGEAAARRFREAEAAFAALTEQTVRGEAFGQLLSWAVENVMALTKIAFDVGDVVVRNLRLAGRADINRLGRQLARTEDKLELLLQEVEALGAEDRAAGAQVAGAGRARRRPSHEADPTEP